MKGYYVCAYNWLNILVNVGSDIHMYHSKMSQASKVFFKCNVAAKLKMAVIIRVIWLILTLLTFSKYISEGRICPKGFPSFTRPKNILIKMEIKEETNPGKHGIQNQ